VLFPAPEYYDYVVIHISYTFSSELIYELLVDIKLEKLEQNELQTILAGEF
jgi:hypothetical protein